MRTASAGAGGWRAHPPATGHQRGPRVGLAQCRRQARQQSNEAAYARCAATANRPDQRATQALMADGRRCAGTASARWRANSRRPNLPPTSTPTTTSRQRRAYRASSSSGYVSRRLRLAAASTQWPGSAPRFGAGVVNSSGQGGHAQSNRAVLFRAQRMITNPHSRLRSELRNPIRQNAGRIPHTSFGGIQAQTGPLPDELLETTGEQGEARM